MGQSFQTAILLSDTLARASRDLTTVDPELLPVMLVFLMTALVHVYSKLLPVPLWLLPCVGRLSSISSTGPHSAPDNRWKNYLTSGVISLQINLMILCFKRPSFLRSTCVDPRISLLLLHCSLTHTTRAGKVTKSLFVANTSQTRLSFPIYCSNTL